MVVVIPGRTPDCQQNDPFGIWAETSPARQRLVGTQGEAVEGALPTIPLEGKGTIAQPMDYKLSPCVIATPNQRNHPINV